VYLKEQLLGSPPSHLLLPPSLSSPLLCLFLLPRLSPSSPLIDEAFGIPQPIVEEISLLFNNGPNSGNTKFFYLMVNWYSNKDYTLTAMKFRIWLFRDLPLRYLFLSNWQWGVNSTLLKSVRIAGWNHSQYFCVFFGLSGMRTVRILQPLLSSLLVFPQKNSGMYDRDRIVYWNKIPSLVGLGGKTSDHKNPMS